MNFPARYAILLDGGFLIKKFQGSCRRFPEAEDIQCLCHFIQAHETLSGFGLLRTYFYHAPPARGKLTNPLDKMIKLDLAQTPTYRNHERLMNRLELMPDFALRLGETVVRNWKLGRQALRSLTEKARAVEPRDLVPAIDQKGVDLRIGLDIARLSLGHMVQALVVVTGDSDLVPAFKFARREGVRVILVHLNHGVRRDLRAHCDTVLSVNWPVPDGDRGPRTQTSHA